MQGLTFLAEAAQAENPIAGLGINGQLLISQLIAFSLLVFILAKFIFPVFMKAIMKREALIEESTRAAREADKNAQKAKEEMDTMFADARVDAEAIVKTAKDEASNIIKTAEGKAKLRADKILNEAHESVEAEVAAAKKSLHNDTVEMVAEATEKVVGKKVDPKTDRQLIERSLKEAS